MGTLTGKSEKQINFAATVKSQLLADLAEHVARATDWADSWIEGDADFNGDEHKRAIKILDQWSRILRAVSDCCDAPKILDIRDFCQDAYRADQVESLLAE